MDQKYYIYFGIFFILILIIVYFLYFNKDSSETSLIARSVNLRKDTTDLTFNRTQKPESAIYSYSANVLIEGVLDNIDTDYIPKYYLFYRNAYDDSFNENAWSPSNHGKNIGLRLDKSDLTKLWIDYRDGTSYKTVMVVDNFPLGKWTNVIVTVNNSIITVYIDSKMAKSIHGSISPPSPTNPIKFSHFKAYLADFRYYMSIINPEIPFTSWIFGIDKFVY